MVVSVLIAHLFGKRLMKALDLLNRREKSDEFILSQHAQLLYRLLDVAYILLQTLYVLLLPVDDLKNVHLSVVEFLLGLLGPLL